MYDIRRPTWVGVWVDGLAACHTTIGYMDRGVWEQHQRAGLAPASFGVGAGGVCEDEMSISKRELVCRR